MKTTNLGELESQVMNVVWNKKQCSVNDVLDELKKDRDIAYTTVATILHRLHQKGLLTKKQHKTFYLYGPALSKSEYSYNLVHSFMSGVMKTFGDAAITSFAESLHKLPKKEKQKLLKMLEKYEDS